LLEPLGIPADAEALYVVLASIEESTADELTRRSGTSPAQVGAQLDTLADLGLAVAMGQGLWRALPLADVVKGLKARRVAEIEAAAIAADTLQNQLLAASHSSDDDVQVFVGQTSWAEYTRLCDETTTEICLFDKPPYVGGPSMLSPDELRDTSGEWRALERGVSQRSVYHPGFDPERLEEMALFAAVGEKSRTAPVPMKLVLFDAKIAWIPSMPSYMPGHERRASFVRHPLIVESLVWLFNAVWDTAIPITAGTYLNGDPRRQMLISLMMSGSTDDAIANQLGINVRSVRRWIAELMDELGVTTRLQLGAALVRADTMKSGA
jgi:DNA-binding transcriptional ArsR family regulator/DNA-binding CsgD family transcriptional regulator